MTIATKFKKDIQTLRAAAEGDIFLDVKNPKLFKKVRRYYLQMSFSTIGLESSSGV